MKPIYSILAFCLLLCSCKKENEPDPETGLPIRVSIELPDNSNLSTDGWTISSIYNDEEPVVKFSAEVVLPANESMEAIIASNKEGHIVLINIIDPLEAQGDNVVLNAQTTAKSMILLHPWAFDLAPQAKKEAMQYMETLPEFQELLTSIETSINSGELDPLIVAPVLEKLGKAQSAIFKTFTRRIEPILFQIDGNTVTVTNELSSAAYGIGIYDQNDELYFHELLPGLEKSYFFFQSFLDLIYNNSSDLPTLQLSIPSDGKWTIKAKSGLSFDGSLENQIAAFENSKQLGAYAMGLFSDELKKTIISNPCFNSVFGSWIYERMENTIKDFSHGKFSKQQFALELLTFFSHSYLKLFEIIEKCEGEYYGSVVKKQFLKKILSFIDIIGKVENGYNASALLTDWIQYDKEIKLCFSKNGSEIDTCEVPKLIDPRDGQEYPIVEIYGKTWTTKNMNFDAAGSLCYGDNPANCEKFGRLYPWDVAVSTACPEGWHLPSFEEWFELIQPVTLENPNLDVYSGSIQILLDEYGFEFKNGGMYDAFIVRYSMIDTNAMYWSSTPNVIQSPCGEETCAVLSYGEHPVPLLWGPNYPYCIAIKSSALSCLCVKN